MLSIPLPASATRQVTNNNKLIETKKKELTWWERARPNATCMRVREGCVWAFFGVRSKVERCYDIIKVF